MKYAAFESLEELSSEAKTRSQLSIRVPEELFSQDQNGDRTKPCEIHRKSD